MIVMLLALQFLSSGAFASTRPIVGGHTVSSSDFISHSVVALISESSRSESLCTASLVAEDLAITAAHCIKDQSRSTRAQLSLIFGLDIRSSSQSSVRAVDRVEIPAEWQPSGSADSDTSDIALLHFSGGLPSGYLISDLLPFNQTLTAGEEIVLAGYGISSATQNSGEGILRKTTVTMLNPNFSPTEVELNQSAGGGACHGDSGGPAYVMIHDHPYLFGITSRGGNGCNQAVIYSKIGAYSDWFTAAVSAIRR